ncbi:MAG: hypothetical protein JWN47_1506 [Frankiales bacterium]|nr:hypothetical protein [Frankiales bacterium]
MEPPTARGNRVLLPTRIVAAVITPFLVLAFLVLFPWPGDTGRLFAWEIKPTMSPMVLGSVYLGGAYFFVRVLRASRWHTVAGGFVPVGTFAALMGITTVLHWDRFLHGNAAFWLWVALYFTTPFVVFAVFFLNQREYAPATDDELKLTPAAANAIAVAGGLSVLMSAFLYLLPHRAIDIWPWHLTPLTARMLGAIFALGLAGLGAVRERRWSAARILLQVEGIMLFLILVAGVRAHDQFDASKALTWLFTAGFLSTALATVICYVRMETRERSISTRGQ